MILPLTAVHKQFVRNPPAQILRSRHRHASMIERTNELASCIMITHDRVSSTPNATGRQWRPAKCRLLSPMCIARASLHKNNHADSARRATDAR